MKQRPTNSISDELIDAEKFTLALPTMRHLFQERNRYATTIKCTQRLQKNIPAVRQAISHELKDASATLTVVLFYKRLCSSLDNTPLRTNLSNEIRTILFGRHAGLRQRDALPPI